jgi:Serine phosphatase RsbU, regulator of sigma subunit
MSLWQPNLSNSQLIDETWGDYYRAAKQPLRAETYYQQALAASIVLQSGVQQIHLLQRLTELYRETQQLQAAYGATMRAYQIQDSIHAFLALRNFASADAEAQHEIDIYHAELKAHMEEAQFNRTRQKRHAIWWMMGGVLLACGFFLYVLSRSYHFRKVSNRHLEAQEREIERTRSELQKTITQNEELRAESMQQTQRINEAKLEIQGHNSQLMNSIEYANSIQQSIFPTERALNPYLAESFLLSRPRDIVSGDLPWFAPVDQALVMAMIDCTGHGVAGASLSFIVYSILNEIVIERRVTDPATIIYQFNQGACNLLANTERKFRSRIRMDISVLSLFPKAGYALYAGWNQFLFYCADGRRIARLMGNPGLLILSEKPVEAAVNQRIELSEKCTFYLATDGYANQMNADLEKIGAARLMALLEEVQPLALSQQKARLVNFLVRHKLGADQTDDITILGFRL